MYIPLKITCTKSSSVHIVHPGSKTWGDFNKLISGFSGMKIILLDENSNQFCLPDLTVHIPHLKEAEILSIKSGEMSKSHETALLLWDELVQKKAGRDTLLINLGGGVVTDLGGFVASTFCRGIPFLNVPTTLMAMADASIGGKTAINLSSGKNLIGSFALPEAAIIYPGFLKTLPTEHLRNGLSEIYKTALIADLPFWDFLTTLTPDKILAASFDDSLWGDLISGSVGIKCRIVEKDFTEKNERALLNFGHSIGHAVESFSMNRDLNPVLHGHAVAVGIICESFLSMRFCDLPEQDFLKISNLFLSLFPLYKFEKEDIPEIIKFMMFDKKIRSGIPYFTLLKSPGKGIIRQKCDEDAIAESLKYYQKISAKY